MVGDNVKEEIKELLHQLSDIFIENDITAEAILEMAIDDAEFQLDRYIVGGPLDYCTWQEHPTINGVFCSTNGKFKFHGVEIPAIKDPSHNGRLSFVVKHGGKRFSYPAAGTILSCFVEKPKVGSYQVAFRNHRSDDLRITNLYWYRLVK